MYKKDYMYMDTSQYNVEIMHLSCNLTFSHFIWQGKGTWRNNHKSR